MFLDQHGLKDKRVHVCLNQTDYIGIGTYLGEGIVWRWHLNGTILVELLENEILASVSSNGIIEKGAICTKIGPVPIVLMDNGDVLHSDDMYITQVKI